MLFFYYLCSMITDKLTSEQVNGVRTLLDVAHNIVILTHMSPDGDAMGSSHGLMHWLRAQGKECHVITPNSAPDFLMWLPAANETLCYDQNAAAATEMIARADLLICTDFNEPKRIGILGDKLLESQAPKIVIDHHLIPASASTDYAAVLMSYPDSPSASELVYRLIAQLGGTLNLDAATCLYTGMMTDTGNFSFNSNYPEMYEIVGNLVALGVDKDAVYDHIFNCWSAERIKLVGYCLYRKMRIFPERHVALIYLSGKELYRFYFKSGDAEGIVNMPLQIKDVYYSVFMREDKVADHELALSGGSKTKIKISMRSQGDRPVNIFCHEVFNGGGHKNASGGEYYGSLPDAVKLFLDNYEKYLLKN